MCILVFIGKLDNCGVHSCEFFPLMVSHKANLVTERWRCLEDVIPGYPIYSYYQD